MLGAELAELIKLLKADKKRYTIKRYESARPYEDADSERVIRIRWVDDECELLVSRFKTKI